MCEIWSKNRSLLYGWSRPKDRLLDCMVLWVTIIPTFLYVENQCFETQTRDMPLMYRYLLKYQWQCTHGFVSLNHAHDLCFQRPVYYFPWDIVNVLRIPRRKETRNAIDREHQKILWSTFLWFAASILRIGLLPVRYSFFSSIFKPIAEFGTTSRTLFQDNRLD